MARPIHKVAFIGSHTPRLCGIATFTADLAAATRLAGIEAPVVAVNDGTHTYDYPPSVQIQIDQHDRQSYRDAAAKLNEIAPDVVCLQHEYGIFGGPAGAYLLDLLGNLNSPIVSTLHTILENPNAEQRQVLGEIIELSETVVVMSRRGRAILESLYRTRPGKIKVVPHGIPVIDPPCVESHRAALGLAGKKVILTFGLISPDKGIENMIRALPAILESHPEAHYVIAGATHPHIKAQKGEEYRSSLERLVEQLKLTRSVRFVNRYLTMDTLTELLQAADVYVTPYLKKEQITSGTLAYAFGSGTAVVSTPYWHAEELLAGGKGLLVPFQDPEALAEAITGLFDDPKELSMMQENGYEQGLTMQWPVIGERYAELFAQAMEASIRALPALTAPTASGQSSGTVLPQLDLRHLLEMTDSAGIAQHCTYCIPNRREGYCTDDNARAAIFAVEIQDKEGLAETSASLQRNYLSFLDYALERSTGRMHNFMSYDRRWLDEAGSEDSHGRGVWALGVLAARSRVSGISKLAGFLMELALPATRGLRSPRACAFAALGLAEMAAAPDANPIYKQTLANVVGLVFDRFVCNSDEDWCWFENRLSYDNARLPEALIRSGLVLDDSRMVESGLRSLEWLIRQQTTEDGRSFSPIGSDFPYDRGGERPVFDQQPLEAAATICACMAAQEATGQPRWNDDAMRAFAWFTGANPSGLPVYDSETGGCCDGVTRQGLNSNKGAESTLAFLSSLVAVESIRGEIAPSEAAYLQ